MPADDAEVLDLATVVGKTKASAKKKNDIAIANLTMTLTFDSMVSLLHASKDSSWPNGLACCINDALHNCFVLQDCMSCVELRQTLNAVTMRYNKDPARLFKLLGSIR